MRGEEARIILGLPPDSRPTPSQVKEAFEKKVWESRPDLFPSHQKLLAGLGFRSIRTSGEKWGFSASRKYRKQKEIIHPTTRFFPDL